MNVCPVTGEFCTDSECNGHRAAAGTKTFAACTHCGEIHEPVSGPSYCPACGDGRHDTLG